MIEQITPRPRDIERKELQDRLTIADDDPEKLRSLLKELYSGHPDNPQIFYMAASQLITLDCLDYRIDRSPDGDTPEIPIPDDAMAAFTAYTRLIAELGQELHAPGPQGDRETSDRLLGVREELIWPGTLAYATAHGADFVALPTRPSLDFNGAREASDLQIYFPLSNQEPIDAQIKRSANSNRETANYDPRIAILSLDGILGNEDSKQLRGLLKAIGKRDDPIGELPASEHEVIMDAAGAMVAAAHDWAENYRSSRLPAA